MPKETQDPSSGMHSEAWWIRLMDDELTAVERIRWEAHLAQCPRCQKEWEAVAYVDDLLRFAPAPQALPVEFTWATVDRIMQRQRLRRLLTFLAGAAIVTLVAVLVFVCMGSALSVVERGLGTVVAARQMLFRSVMQVVLTLFFGWRSILPFVLGLLALGYLVLMPNGFLVTAALIWLSGHKRVAGPVQV